MVYIFGHKIPDTDAILSSMVCARFREAQGKEATCIKLGECNNETKFALNYLGWKEPNTVTSLAAGTEVVLIDHNEKGQTIDGIEDLKITTIIDHHQVSNLNTHGPIDILIKPIASSCSVLYWLWKCSGIQIPQDAAKAMMLGIISDTLYFRSPTTTDYDKKIFDELNEIAQIKDPEALSLEMFNAKSDLGDISIKDLVMLDYKNFDAGAKKFGIGSVETTNPSYALGRKDEIVKELLAVKSELKLDFIMLSVVDILNEKNTSIVPSQEDADIVKAVFDTTTENNIADLGNRISRKKTVASPLATYFETI